MAVFAVLFGTRHIDATEHQEGLMLAIAAESVVKIAAFLIVGAFITYSMFGGIGPLIERAAEQAGDHRPVRARLSRRQLADGDVPQSSVCILLLTRQFHVTIVENNSEREVGRATWLFPLYLIAINIFVIPIAIAGLLTFKPGEVDADMFLLALPRSQGAEIFTIIAFLGGLSAATAMVIVESVALSIMVCNDLVDADHPAPPAARHRRPARHGRDAAEYPARGDLRHPAAGLSVLPRRRRHLRAGADRPVVLRRHRAIRAGVLRRPDLARARRRAARSRAFSRASPCGPTRC